MNISDALLPELDQELATTRKCLSRIPEDKFNYKPHPKSFDMISLAVHISTMLGWGVTTLQADSFDYAPEGGEPYVAPTVKTNTELMELFEKGAAEFRSMLAAADNEAMMKPWSLLGGGKVMFTMPKVAVIRGMIFNHIVHHRGQLSVYLRMCDIPVPAMYGPSADEAN
ncbi:MAG: DinB family protein [Candidatus Solibacter sp.]